MKNIPGLCICTVLAVSIPLAAGEARAPHVRRYQQRLIPPPGVPTYRGTPPVQPPGTIPSGMPELRQSISPSGTPQLRQPRS